MTKAFVVYLQTSDAPNLRSQISVIENECTFQSKASLIEIFDQHRLRFTFVRVLLLSETRKHKN